MKALYFHRETRINNEDEAMKRFEQDSAIAYLFAVSGPSLWKRGQGGKFHAEQDPVG